MFGVEEFFLFDILILFFLYYVYILFGRLLSYDNVIDLGLVFLSSLIDFENLSFIVEEINLFFDYD